MPTVEQQLQEALSEITALRAAVDEHALVAITDSSGRVTFVNDKFCAISKYSREELLGHDLRIINSDYHPKEFIADLWATITIGKSWHGEFKNRAKDGSLYWVETTISPRLNEEGKPSHYISIGTDITAYALLRKTAAAFETVMKTTTDHIFFKDRFSRFVRASQAHLKFFGITKLEELRGKTDLDFFTEEHALEAAQDETDIMRNGVPILNKEEKETHADGLVTWALTSKFPWHDKEGQVIGVMGVSRDITTQKEAQLEAGEWQSRFKFLLDCVPLGIAWSQTAADGRMLWRLINDEHLRICGLNREEDHWDTFRRISHPDDVVRQDELVFQVAQGKIDRYSIEKRYIRPDGETVWVLLSYRLLSRSDGTFEEIFTVIDITDRKARESTPSS